MTSTTRDEWRARDGVHVSLSSAVAAVIEPGDEVVTDASDVV